MLFQTGCFALALVLLLAGCAAEAPREKEFLAPESQGAQDILVTRGIASEGTLFVQLDKQVNVRCTVGWEILGDDVAGTEVVLMLENFRMVLQDAMDGLTTDGAWADDMEDFVTGTVESIAESLSDGRISVRVDKLEIERVEDP